MATPLWRRVGAILAIAVLLSVVLVPAASAGGTCSTGSGWSYVLQECAVAIP